MATVITQQPYIKTQNSAWSSGICDCCEDMNSCCYGLWCFPCLMCSSTGEFGESPCLPLLDIIGPALLASFGIPTCVPPVTLGMRVAVRHKYNIAGSLCDDIMMSCICLCCSWCQMSREIKARKQTVTIIQTVPTVVQPIPMLTTTQVVYVDTVAPVAATEIEMEPIKTGLK